MLFWKPKKEYTKQLTREVYKCIIEKKANDLKGIIKQSSDFEEKVGKVVNVERVFKEDVLNKSRENVKSIYDKIILERANLAEETEKIENAIKYKQTDEEIYEAISKLRDIEVKFDNSIQKEIQVLYITTEEFINKSFLNMKKIERRNIKVSKKLKDLKLLTVLAFALATFVTMIVIFINSKVHLIFFFNIDNLISLLIISSFINGFVTFAGLRIYDISSYILKRIKMHYLLYWILVFMFIIIPSLLTAIYIFNSNALNTSIYLSLVKFVKSVRELDLISLVISILAVLASLDALINMFDRVQKLLLKLKTKTKKKLER